MTIREKIDYLTALENVLNMVDDRIRDCMEMQFDDETGEILKDKNGNYIYKAPTEDMYRYHDYMGLKAVKAQLEKLAEKA